MSTPQTAQPFNSVICPGCGASTPVYSRKSIFFACAHCTIFIQQKQGVIDEVAILTGSNDAARMILPRGATGRIDNKDFVVTGFMEKQDTEDAGVSWKEYMLYCAPQDIYYVLAEYQGHWMLIWHIAIKGYKKKKMMGRWEVQHHSRKERFRHYVDYKFRYLSIQGEFDENVLDDENKLAVSEYIKPPAIIVIEQKLGFREDWYRGRHVEPAEVSEAFGVPVSSLPRRTSLGAIEPAMFERKFGPFMIFSWILVGLIVLTQIFVTLLHPPGEVYREEFNLARDSAASAWGSDAMNPVSSLPFKIKKGGAVKIDLSTDIVNEWMEVQVLLRNEQTGKEYELTKVIEYYSGYDVAYSESWSEGSHDASAVLSAVPAGTYRLSLFPFSDAKRTITLNARVEENAPLKSNMLWALGVVGITIAVQYFRREELIAKRML